MKKKKKKSNENELTFLLCKIQHSSESWDFFEILPYNEVYLSDFSVCFFYFLPFLKYKLLKLLSRKVKVVGVT